MPGIGFGTLGNVGDAGCALVEAALAEGYRYIDTSRYYGNEEAVGKALARSSVPRGDIWVTTKLLHPRTPPQPDLALELEKSLRLLQTDYVDLLLIHWPPADENFDSAIDSLCAAQSSGLARAIGVSNFTIPLMKRAAKRAALPLINNQVEFHPLLDQSRVREEAEKLGIVLSAYSPLGRGAVLKDPTVVEVAKRLGRPPSEVALRWIVQQGVVAVPMTTKKENAKSNMRIFDFELSPADMAKLTEASKQNRRLISPTGWAPKWD